MKGTDWRPQRARWGGLGSPEVATRPSAVPQWLRGQVRSGPSHMCGWGCSDPPSNAAIHKEGLMRKLEQPCGVVGAEGQGKASGEDVGVFWETAFHTHIRTPTICTVVSELQIRTWVWPKAFI